MLPQIFTTDRVIMAGCIQVSIFLRYLYKDVCRSINFNCYTSHYSRIKKEIT